jgi:hypothetical protein
MKITVQLTRSTFYFLEDVSLTKGGITQVDMDNRSDSFISSLVASIKGGILEADIGVEDLICMVKDNYTRLGLKIRYGLDADEKDLAIKEEAEAVVISVDEKIDEVDEVDEAVSEEVEPEAPAEVDLQKILAGSAKNVLASIKNDGLTDEQLESMLELEKANKGRAMIIAALTEV